MFRKFKSLRNLYVVWRYRATLEKCSRIIGDPNSRYAQKVEDLLSGEELDGVFDMATIDRVMGMDVQTLKKELKHLEDSLDIKL